MKIEASVSSCTRFSLTVDDAACRASFAADGDCLSEKVDIAVAGAGIGAGGDDDYIAVVTVIDGILDGGILAWNQEDCGWG